MCYGLVISKQLSAKETVFSDGGLGAFFFFFLGDSGEECGRALEAGTSKSGPAIY